MIKDNGKKAKKALSNALTQVFMVCGTLLAIANGFIPSLSAMIYGGLTDELVVRQMPLNCTSVETVSSLNFTNVAELQLTHSEFPGIVINESSVIELVLNGTWMSVEVVTNGKTVIREKISGDNIALPRINGTVVNGTRVTEIKITGTSVKIMNVKGELVNGNRSEVANKIERNETTEGKPNSTLITTRRNETTEGKPNGTLITTNEVEGNNSYENVNKSKNIPNNQHNDTNISERREEFTVKHKKLYVNDAGERIVLKYIDMDKKDQDRVNEAAAERRRRSTFETIIHEMALNDANVSDATQIVTSTKRLPQMFTSETPNMKDENAEKSRPRPSVNKLMGDEAKLQANNSAMNGNITNQEAKANNSEINGNITNREAKANNSAINGNITIREPRANHTAEIGLSNITYVLRNVTEECYSKEERLDIKMRKYAMYYVYAALATFVCAYGQIVFWNLATERGAQDAEVDLTESALQQDPGLIDTKIYEGAPNLQGMGDLGGVDPNDVKALSGGLGGEIAYLIQSVSNFASSFVVSFIQNWKITLVMMAAGPVMASVEVLVHKIEAYIKRQKEELQRKASSMAKKSLGSIKTVVANTGENVEKGKYSQKLEASNQLNRLKSLVLGLEKGFMTMLSFGFLGLAFWYSTTLLTIGAVTPGALMTIFMAIISGAMQMEGAGEQADDVAGAQGPLDSLLGFCNQGAEEAEDLSNKLDDFAGKLDVFNVYFHYPSRPEYQVLKSVNICIEDGQTVALLGDGGCGKSTLIKLLQRIYDPQNGKVCLDGHDLRELDRRWFRRQIGIVHKFPEFFNTTIAENIAYGREGCTLKEVMVAAQEAGAEEFIMDLPRAYATVLSDDGSPLNSYQKHLLALARALIRQPKILLWEEDMSLMDEASLGSLIAHLNRARRGRTTVISTSHVSVARIADVIVIVHEGEVIETGTPAELLDSRGAYSYMCTVQHFEMQARTSQKDLKSGAQFHAATKEGQASGVSDKTDEMKGAASRVQQMIQQKITEGKAKYQVLKPQLVDAPLMLAAAAGASITGMMAPGLSYLFGEIQKFLNEPARVEAEGMFFASMFLVLGFVVAFGGTIETYMTTMVTEKLRSRMLKSAFESKLNQHSVPQKGPSFPPGSAAFGDRGLTVGLPPTLPQGTLPAGGDSKDIPAQPTGQARVPMREPSTPGAALGVATSFPGLAGASEGMLPEALRPEGNDGEFQPSQDVSQGSLAGGLPLPSNVDEGRPGLPQSSFQPDGMGQTAPGVLPSAKSGSAPALPGKELPGEYDTAKIGAPDALQPPPDILLPVPDPQAQAQEAMDQVQRDIDAALQNSIGRYLGPRVQQSVSSVVTMLLAFYNGWKMTLVVLAGLPIIAAANKFQGGSTEEKASEPEGIDEVMSTSFKKFQTISAIGAENKFANKYKDAAMEKYKLAIKKIIASGLAFAFSQATVFLIYAAALRFGCYLVQVGDMTAMAVMSVLMTVLFGSSATAGARAPSHESEGSEESMERLLDQAEDEVPNIDTGKMGGARGSVSFEHVEFSDPLNKSAPLLSGLDTSVSSGSTLALVALDKYDRNPVEFLLERFYDPSHGRVLLDNEDIRSLEVTWLRSQHAVVSEHGFLSHCSIAENIAYGDNTREVSRQEIEDAAYSANAHTFISSLPQGYDTVIDDEEVSLTSGQRLRITIARACVRNPAVLIIQELRDPDEEVDRAIHMLSRNRTCFVVARNRSTVESADKIILVYRGRVIEQGTHEELIARRALYFLLTTPEYQATTPEL